MSKDTIPDKGTRLAFALARVPLAFVVGWMGVWIVASEPITPFRAAMASFEFMAMAFFMCRVFWVYQNG